MRRLANAAFFVCLLVAAAAQQPAPDGNRLLPPMPPGEGRDLVQTGSLGCHNWNMIFQNRKAQAGWTKKSMT